MTAGLFAALASVFGKLALDPSFLENWLSLIFPNDPASYFSLVLYTFKIFCMCGIVASNAVLWNFLAKSMDISTSVDAVVINNAFNFFFTALFGWAIFSERISALWILGAIIILIGVYIMNIGQRNSDQSKLSHSS